jgi:hypothetical protein
LHAMSVSDFPGDGCRGRFVLRVHNLNGEPIDIVVKSKNKVLHVLGLVAVVMGRDYLHTEDLDLLWEGEIMQRHQSLYYYSISRHASQPVIQLLVHTQTEEE